MRNQSSFAPSRRRRSPLPMLLLILLVLFIGFLLWLGFSKTEVPTATVEQDVTNEVLAR
ncbi:MAG TPA: hypothetical protein VLK25_01960 [Allosphingosinicella sp.]|nr:hypothetical protein [Allosphingosinicella sp.]